jgi:hypothetical protein
MTGDFPRMAFPNESREHREARDAQFGAEIALRRQTEAPIAGPSRCACPSTEQERGDMRRPEVRAQVEG